MVCRNIFKGKIRDAGGASVSCGAASRLQHAAGRRDPPRRPGAISIYPSIYLSIYCFNLVFFCPRFFRPPYPLASLCLLPTMPAEGAGTCLRMFRVLCCRSRVETKPHCARALVYSCQQSVSVCVCVLCVLCWGLCEREWWVGGWV